MPKKSWTDEERKAFGAKMKAARQAKEQAEKIEPETTEVSPEIPANQELPELLKEINELRGRLDELTKVTPTTQQPTLTGGKVTGVFERYIMDPSYYPDPIERLSHEPRLARFGFEQSYFLKFSVTPMVPYERKDGILETQPKFTLELHKWVEDPDTGELTDKAFKLFAYVYFEDPQTAIVIAREQGLPVDNSNEKAFLDEMRYIRMRDWLMECFYPTKPKTESSTKQTVIGNRVVEVYEVSNLAEASSPNIPFNNLKGKV